jgi:long-chain-acyl-CoA dehydrogenase
MSTRKYKIDEIFITPRTIYDEEPKFEKFRARFREFIRIEKLQTKLTEWEDVGHVDKGVFQRAMAQGFYLPAIPTKYGGHGLTDFRYNAIISEELEYHDIGSIFFPLGSDIVLPYFTEIKTDSKDKLISPTHLTAQEQKELWLPYITRTKSIIALCISEFQGGSDIQSIKTTAKWIDDKQKWVINGTKLWISSGKIANLLVVVAITGDVEKLPVHKCLSLFVIKSDDVGFKVTKTIEKIGRHAQDTASLSFNNVEVGPDRLLGQYNQGFKILMQNLSQERLGVAVSAIAGTCSVLRHTLNYINYRKLFNRSIADFQYVQFRIAEFIAQFNILQIAIDNAILLHTQHKCNHVLSSALKQQSTELYSDISGYCLQFLGGVGYLKSNPVANHFVDSKVTTVYAGSNHIMLEIIARKFGLERAPPPTPPPTSPSTLPAHTTTEAKL